MSTITICYPKAIRETRAPNLRLILILVSSVSIASTILGIVISANADLTNHLPVSQNSITAVPVPTPPTADIQPASSGTPAPFSGQASDLSVVAVPVPAP